MGDVEVPADALWRAQTQRAVDNFPISGQPLQPALVHALARVKAAAARVNADLGVITAEQRDAIVAARRRDRRGRRTTTQFPIDVFQTGSGTSTNMNVNEVHRLARRTGRRRVPPQRPRQRQPVLQRHLPDRDPRRGRRSTLGPLVAGAGRARTTRSTRKAEEFADAVKSGRTHLMDATPVTLGQELGGYAAHRRATPPSGSRRPSPACASCRSAARRSAPASTPRPASPRGRSPHLDEDTGQPFTEAAQPLRGAGHPGLAGRAERRAPDVRRRA